MEDALITMKELKNARRELAVRKRGCSCYWSPESELTLYPECPTHGVEVTALLALGRATRDAELQASDDTPDCAFRAGDRVEWNPTGDVWKPGTVQQDDGIGVLLALDENDQTLLVSPEHLRQLGSAPVPTQRVNGA